MVDENSADNDVTAAILDNDSDIEGDTLTVSSVFNATGGTVNLAAGVVTFTPDADLCGNGEASFDYAISDGHGGTDSAHVTVDINCVSNVPPVAVDDSPPGTEDTDLVIDDADLVGNDTDTDDRSPSAPSSNATGGTVDAERRRHRHLHARRRPVRRRRGRLRLHGRATATAAATRATSPSTSPASTTRPVAVNDAATIAQASGPADHDVLANDTDTEGDALSITGTLVVSPVNAGVAAEHNGMLQFTPASNFHGTVVITYTADDGNGGTDHATLTITVTPESTPPVAVAPGVAFSAGSRRPVRAAPRHVVRQRQPQRHRLVRAPGAASAAARSRTSTPARRRATPSSTRCARRSSGACGRPTARATCPPGPRPGAGSTRSRTAPTT